MARQRPSLDIVVVDTMVVAYALLGVTSHRDASATLLERARQIVVPDVLLSELTNVIAQWIKAKHVTLELGLQVLRDAVALFTAVEPAERLCERALQLSVGHGHPAYDMMFVALSERLNAPLLSYDSKLARLFPDRVFTPDQVLAN
jgi:predicted nucleic acid-binding protein